MSSLKKENFYYSSLNTINNCYTFNSKDDFTFHLWKNATTVYHQHNNYVEIFIVTKGSISNTMLGETQILQPGSIGVIFPNTPHIHEKINNDECQIINVTCSSEKAMLILKEIYNRETYESLIFTLSKNELALSKSFRNMILSSQDGKQLNSLISAFFVYLLGLLPATITHQKIPVFFQEYLTLLQNTDLAYIKIQDLYKMSNYSQRSLSSYFQKYLGKTLVQYVNELKLTKAKNMLHLTDLPITEICFRSGFNTIAHFNHLFKNYYGLSPKDCRNKK